MFVLVDTFKTVSQTRTSRTKDNIAWASLGGGVGMRSRPQSSNHAYKSSPISVIVKDDDDVQ